MISPLRSYWLFDNTLRVSSIRIYLSIANTIMTSHLDTTKLTSRAQMSNSDIIRTPKIPPRNAQPISRLEQMISQVSDQRDFSQSSYNPRYDLRISNLQAGYKRSKEQYQTLLKNIYKEKVFLLNVIASSQPLLDEFRSRVNTSSQTYRQLKSKCHIIENGLYHQLLCAKCVANISSSEFKTCLSLMDQVQTQTETVQAVIIRNPEQSNKKVMRKQFQMIKQYSWGGLVSGKDYKDMERIRGDMEKMKAQIAQLVKILSDTRTEQNKKMMQKNKQIDELKVRLTRQREQHKDMQRIKADMQKTRGEITQLTKTLSDTRMEQTRKMMQKNKQIDELKNKIARGGGPQQSLPANLAQSLIKEINKNNQRFEKTIQIFQRQQRGNDSLIRDLNNQICEFEAWKLNQKYKNRYF